MGVVCAPPSPSEEAGRSGSPGIGGWEYNQSNQNQEPPLPVAPGQAGAAGIRDLGNNTFTIRAIRRTLQRFAVYGMGWGGEAR